MNWNDPDIANATFTHKNEQSNCPNCGAPIDSEKCPYCGTVFVDFAAMDADKPFFMKIKKNGAVFVVKVILNSADMCSHTTDLYRDNMLYTSSLGLTTELTMNFTVVK